MSVRKSHAVAVTAIVAAMFASGCGAEKGPEIAEVKGQVTLDGKPLTHGEVYFMPDNAKGTSGPMSMAEIGEDGHFTITSAGDRKGAVIGFHKIRVECRMKPKDFRDTQPASLIPEAYNNPQTSGLTAEVKAGEENVVELKLDSKKKNRHDPNAETNRRQ